MTTQTTAKNDAQNETPKVDLNGLAKSGEDQYLSQVWPDINSTIKDLKKRAEDLKKYTPPSNADVAVYIKDHGKEDEVIQAAQNEINALVTQMEQLKKKQTDRVKQLLHTEELPEEELAKMRTAFAEKRQTVVNQIDAFKFYAQAMQKPELVEAFDALSVPRFTHGLGGTSGTSNAPKNPETAALREWAEKKGITVPERGRIKQEIWDQFHAETQNSKK